MLSMYDTKALSGTLKYFYTHKEKVFVSYARPTIGVLGARRLSTLDPMACLRQRYLAAMPLFFPESSCFKGSIPQFFCFWGV